MRLLNDDPDVKVVLFDRNPDMSRPTGFDSPVPGVRDRYTPVEDRITSSKATAVKLFVDAVQNYLRPDQGARAVRRLKFRSGHADVS